MPDEQGRIGVNDIAPANHPHVQQFSYDSQIVHVDDLQQTLVDQGRRGLEVIAVTPYAYAGSERYEQVVRKYLVVYRVHPASTWPLMPPTSHAETLAKFKQMDNELENPHG